MCRHADVDLGSPLAPFNPMRAYVQLDCPYGTTNYGRVTDNVIRLQRTLSIDYPLRSIRVHLWTYKHAFIARELVLWLIKHGLSPDEVRP